MRSEAGRLPELFLDRLRKVVPQGKWDQIANTFTQAKPTTFRVNTLKTSRESVRQKLEHEGFRLESVPWYPEVFIVRNARLKELEQTASYRKGEIYVQSLSSMVPPLILEPKPGETILDLTAAPGGKTTQMACLMIPPPALPERAPNLSQSALETLRERQVVGMKGEGKIIANESDKIRYEKLKSNVELQGAKNVELLLSYGESIGRKYPGHFDRILLDAPCSSEGRFNTRTPSSYRYWSLETVQDNAKLQKKLLASALTALKPGGTLVYSTCTFAPEENEGVLNDALERFKGAIEIVGAPLRSISNQMAGLIKWDGINFQPSLRKTVRILPTSDMEGFFIARLRKSL